MLFLFFLAFIDPEITSDHFRVEVLSSPSSAQVEVVIAHPYDNPIHIEGIRIQIPRYLELAFNQGSFLANMAQFSNVTLIMGEATEHLELDLREEYQTLWPGKTMRLMIGQFTGPSEIVSAFEPTLKVETTTVDFPLIPFELAYAKKIVTKKGEPAFELSRKFFAAALGVPVPTSPPCDTIVTVIPPYTSSYCGADCVAQPIPAGCVANGTYGSMTVNGPFTVTYPKCACTDETI